MTQEVVEQSAGKSQSPNQNQEQLSHSADKSQSPKQNQEQPSHSADKSQSPTQNQEQEEISYFVDRIEEVCSASDEESDEGQCSEEEVEVVMTLDSPSKLEIKGEMLLETKS